MAKVKKTEWVILRMSVFDKAVLKKNADEKGITISQFIRKKLGFKN